MTAIGYGQNAVDWDSLSHKTSVTNADYGLVISGTPSKIYGMTMEYYLPMVYTGDKVYPRSIATNMILGATSNSGSYKLDVHGTSYFTENMTLFTLKRFYFSGNAYITNSAYGELSFTDAVNGTLLLHELGGGGGGDVSVLGTPTAGQNTVWSSASVIRGADSVLVPGSDSWNIRESTTHLLIGNDNAVAININNVNGTHSNIGLTGTLNLHPMTEDVVSAKGNVYYNQTANRLFVNTYIGTLYDTVSVDRKAVFKIVGDSAFFGYLDGGTTGTRFLVVTSTGAADSGVLNTVFRGLTDPLWNIHKQLSDTVNGEIPFYHIDNVTKELIKTYGLPNGMDAFEALQYTAEMSLRLIAEQDLRIEKLEQCLRIDKLQLILGSTLLILAFGFIITLTRKK